MLRRSVLVTMGTMTQLVGCLGRNQGSVEAKPYPDHPNELTNESVLEYVREYEEATVHNRNVDGDVIDLSVGCDVVPDRVVDGTFYVVSVCAGGIEWRESGAIGHGDIRTDPSLVLVTDDDIHRFEKLGYEVLNRSGDPPRLHSVNLGETSHTLTVEATRQGEAGDPAFRETISLESESDHTVADVVFDDTDSYDLVATLEDGTSEPYQWDRTEELAGYDIVDEDENGNRRLSAGTESVRLPAEESLLPDLGVYVTPDGELSIDTLRNEWAVLE